MPHSKWKEIQFCTFEYDVLLPAIHSFFDAHVHIISDHWTVQTLDDALVGRCSEQNESDQIIRFAGLYFWVGLHRHANNLSYMIRLGISVLFLLILTQCTHAPKQETQENAVNMLPALDLQLTTGEKLKTNSRQGKIILIFFNPDCDHCQRQADDISHNIKVFKGQLIYFIGSNTLEELTHFSQTYKLNEYPNVFFATAAIENVTQAFGPIGVPSIFIYSDQGVLIKRFDNETKVAEIAKFI
jgi:peroxiredoxin